MYKTGIKFFLLAFPILWSGVSIAIYIRNETGQACMVGLTDTAGRAITNLYFGARGERAVSNPPIQMTVYLPNGYCSYFDDIGMNQSIFDRVTLRRQRRNPACAIIGFTGRSREDMPVPIRHIVFAPSPGGCRARCWNPRTGEIFPTVSPSNQGAIQGVMPNMGALNPVR